MKLRPNYPYPFLVWLFTLLTGPLAYLLIGAFQGKGGGSELFMFYFIVLAYSIVFSFPLLGVSYLVFLVIVRSSMPDLSIRVILGILTVAGIFLTFYLLRSTLNSPIEVPSSYILPALIAVFWIKPRKTVTSSS